jgi:hypothetical protein
VNSHFYRIDSRSELALAIENASRAGAIGETILLRALFRDEIAHWQIPPGSSKGQFKRYASAAKHRPAVVVIPADDYSERGPAHWPAAEKAVQWAKSIIVHAAGSEPEHYLGAIEAAKITRRVLLIECCSATKDAWLKLVGAAPNKPALLLILPRDGLHPAPIPKAAMQ